ncbi:hypothetical protein [Bifidobacterium hapali]|uniref:hypothetical protein n=1 Tax=Bifidobacterium hapali TaxID=1630172 RepID=UPI0013030753|nr:hypothetical protein [Bifidobacterium hapali]
MASVTSSNYNSADIQLIRRSQSIDDTVTGCAQSAPCVQSSARATGDQSVDH